MSADVIRIVFLGTPMFATPALEALAASDRVEIAAVVTQPDRPAGRGQKLTPPPVKTCGEALGLPVFQTASIKKDAALKEHLRELAPDFLVTVAFGQILTQDVLDIPKIATVNAHASLLPEFRGANPIQQAILQGKTVTGITTMLTELGVDTGPMLLKATVAIGADETMGELTIRLSQLSGPLLVETLTGMVDRRVQPETQPHAEATHAPKCEKEEALLDWSEPAALLALKIRAFNPAPGASTFLDGERVKILRARALDADASDVLKAGNSGNILKNGAPGELLVIIESGIIIATGGGWLEIRSLQPAGKREMPARDWALGALKGDISGKRFTREAAAPENCPAS